MDAASIVGQPNLAPQPDQGNTLEVPSKLKARNPFEPRAELIKAIIGRESGGKKDAVGKVGELGLMQVRPETAAQYGVTPDQLRDPKINQNVGTRYFTDLLKKYKGNEFMALMAYNSGPGRVDKGELLPQSIKYATSILNKAKGASGLKSEGKDAMPTMVSQSQIGPASNTPQHAPSVLSKIGGAIGNFFEGTANAEELPPLPSGVKPVAQVGSEPTDAQLKPSTPGTAMDPPAKMPPNLPPLPSGAKPTFDPSRFKTSFGIGPGGIHMSVNSVQPPAAERTQVDQANVALQQATDAISYYDQKIKPREGEFTGSLMSNPKGALKGFAQWPEYSHSRYTSLAGMQGDPDVKDFYAKIGPMQAAVLRGLVGGRIGIGISQYLGPHLPDPSKDDLPTMRQKLDSMKRNIPIILSEMKKLQGQGMSDDDISSHLAAMPYQDGQAEVAPSGADLSPDEQQLIDQYR